MLLKRVSSQPIFLPNPTSDWETTNVFNPAVVHHNGLWHMWYRAQGLDWISRIGYAVSADGIEWNRLQRPILQPGDATDSRGVEDPRVLWLDGRFVMTYTAYGSQFSGEGEPTHSGGGVLPMVAVSDNGIIWQRLGPIVRGEDNKDHVLFPRKINGRYAALHRRWPDVWIAYSDDLRIWLKTDMARLYGPRHNDPSAWDSKSVGSNGIPIETEQGWLLLNHGYNDDHIYQFGVILLDLDDPTRVMARSRTSIFWPQELWELRGDVPNVVFSCANPVVEGTIYVYYGGGDHAIGLATCSLAALLDFAIHSS